MAAGEYERLNRIKPNLISRAEIIRYTRNYFQQYDFLEVETPVRVPVVAPELFITPVTSGDWFLITSPELHMKRLMAAGYPKLFQFSHCFRKDERGRRHNPEFTMLEWYRSGGDYMQMVADTEQIVFTLAQKIYSDSSIQYQGFKIDLSVPWPRVTISDAFLKSAGWDPVADPDPLRFDTDLCDKVIPAFTGDRPTVIMDYPAPMASLARLKPGEAKVAERAEIFIGGLEIANAYSELIDSQEQENRFRIEIEQIEKEYGRKLDLPRQFLDAMDTLPECGGIALGVDRLVMLFCNAASIDDVMPFTVDTA
jgi:elongation factor P--(R)-beta-lysine ligase